MVIFLGSGKISHCIGGWEGGTGAQRSLHVRIPLDPAIPAVVSACQSDYTSQSYANFSRNRFNQPLHQWERRTLKEALEHNPLYTYRSLSIPRFQWWYPLVNQTTCHRVMLIFLGTASISHCISGREGGTGAQRSLHVRIPPNPTIPAVVSACQSDHTTQSYPNLSRIRFNQPLHRL